MRNRFRDELLDARVAHPNLQLIVSDIGFGVFETFKDRYPDDYLNLGISEANIIGVASGMASFGYIPVVYTIVPFLIMRPFEQIRVDLALQRRQVILIGVGGGLAYGALGPTHHSFEDLALAMSLPNMQVFSPAEPDDVRGLLNAALEHHGPSYIRLGKNGEQAFGSNKKKKLSIYSDFYGEERAELLIISVGPISFNIFKLMEESSVNFHLVKTVSLKPICNEVLELCRSYSKILVVEEHTTIVGYGNYLAKMMLTIGIMPKKFKHIGLIDKFNEDVGSRDYLLAKNNLDNFSLIKLIKEM